MSKRYYNTTDASVVIDTDGHVVDGHSFFTADDSDVIDQAVATGALIQVDEPEQSGDQSASTDDTVEASGETTPADETLSPKVSGTKSRKSTPQNKEK